MKKICFVLLMISYYQAAAQWKYANFPYGGDVRSIVSNSRKQLFISASKSIFTSTDNGTNWTYTSDGIPGGADILTTVDTMVVAASTIQGLYLSLNNGKNWSHNSLFPDTVVITCLTSKGTTLFVGTAAHGLYRSNNGGVDWFHIYHNLPSDAYINSLTITDTSVFAGTNSGAFLSKDAGSNWTEVNNGLPAATPVFDIKHFDKKLYATTPDKLFTSADNGNTWTEVQFPWMTYLSTLGVHNNTLYMGSQRGVFKSLDGSNWTESVTGLPVQSNIHTFATTPSGIFTGTTKGIFSSADDGATWLDKNAGLTAAPAMSLLSEGNILFCGVRGKIVTTSDAGVTWTEKSSGLGSDVFANTLARTDSGIFLASHQEVYITTNKGDNWHAAVNGLPLLSFSINDFAAEQNELYAAVAPNGIYYSKYNGTDWKNINSNLPANINILSLAADATTLLIGTTQGELFMTTDKGLNWSAIPIPLPLPAGIYHLKIVKDIFYAGTYDGLYISEDKGLSWTKRTMENSAFQKIIYLNSNGKYMFAATFDKVFMSEDEGKNWRSVSDGLPQSTVNALEIHGNLLFAALSSRGVWYRPLSEVVTGIQENADQNTFTIYPNPGHGVFTLFTTDEYKQIKVTDVRGVCVFQTGTNDSTVLLDLSNLAKGMYLVNITEKNGKNLNQKLIIQ